MKEQLGAKFMQFTLWLEGCHLIGPWQACGGLQTWLGHWPNPIQSPPFLCLTRGHTPREAFFLMDS